MKHLQKFSHSNRWIQFPLGSIRLYGLVGPDRDIFPIPPIPAHVIPKISGTGWLGLPRWMEGTQEVLWSIKKCQHKSLLGGFHLPTCGSDFQWPKQAAWLGALTVIPEDEKSVVLGKWVSNNMPWHANISYGSRKTAFYIADCHSFECGLDSMMLLQKIFTQKVLKNNLHKKNVNPKRQRGSFQSMGLRIPGWIRPETCTKLNCLSLVWQAL